MKVGTSWSTAGHRPVDGSVSLINLPCRCQSYCQIADEYCGQRLVLTCLQSVKTGSQQVLASLSISLSKRELSFQAKGNSVIRSQGVLFRPCDQPFNIPVRFRPISCPEKNGHRRDPANTKRDRVVKRVRPL